MFAINRNNFGYSLTFIVLVIFIARVLAVQHNKHTQDHPQPCIEWTLNHEQKSTEQDCVLGSKNTSYICMGTFNMSTLPSIHRLRNAKGLDLCGWQSPTLDPSIILKFFPKVQYLGISYGNLSDIIDSFPDLFYLETINISYTKLFTLNVNLFKFVRNLKVLDLRFNKLKYLDAPLHLPSGIQELYLSGNAWNCSRSLRWLLHSEKFDLVVDRNSMVCSDPKYNGRHLLTVAHYKKIPKLECQAHEELRNCTCTVHYIIKSEDGKSLTPIYAVNCSNLGFYHFPSYLPQNTTIFYANNNNISDIRPLRNNEIYRNIVDLYLDDNDIRSIDVLDAGYWLRHFRVLSLKRNHLHRLPVYALDNALEFNANAVNLQLSQNPWVCDCKFGMRFQEILMKYHTIIQDSWNVTCSFMDEEENVVISRVLSVQRTDVCKLPPDNSLFPLDLLSGVLATLIIFILAKLGYDYYNYKNYGQLPWIVTKLP